MNTPTFDSDGYPTDETLAIIASWPVITPADRIALIVFAAYAINDTYGRAEIEGDVLLIVTGGWGGNEAVVDALSENTAFWSLCWQKSERGGIHVFRDDAEGVA